MHFKELRLLALFFFVSHTFAFAAPISMSDAILSARERSEKVLLADADVVASDEKVSQGSGRLFPSINLLGSYSRQDQSGVTTSAQTRPDQYSARINLTQPIFHGFGEFAELRSRKALREAAKLNKEAASLSLSVQVAQSFYQILSNEQDLANLKLILELSEKRLAELRTRAKIGRTRVGEVLAAEAQLASLEAQRETTLVQISQSRLIFSELTRIPDNAELALKGEEPPSEVVPVEKYLEKIENRPDIRAALCQVESNDESVGVAKAAHYPGLDFSANYYLARTGILEKTKWDIGAALTIPIFQGGVLSSGVREAQSKKQAADLKLAQVRKAAETEIRSYHSNLSRSLSQFRLLERATSLAEKNYKTQTNDYRFGLVNNLEVLSSLNLYFDTKRSLDRLRFQLLTLNRQLDASTGKNL